MLAVTATGREAEDLHAALQSSLGAGAVALFPSWETLPHERLSPRSDTVGQRLSVLRRLAHPETGDDTHGALSVVIAPVRAVLQPISKGLGDLKPVALQAGDDVPLEQVVEALAAAAYARTDLVERRGEFAVRGGILDVFPPTEEHPLRLEFWGDTVEEIRWFKVADQRSLEVAEHGLWAPPCRELLLTDAVRARAATLADQLPGAADLLEKLAQGIAVEGMESLAPALVDGMETLLDLLPDGAVLVACDPERVRTRAHDLTATSQEFLDAGWANAASGNAVPIDLASVLGTASFRTLAELREQARELGVRWLDLTPFAGDDEGDTLDLGLEIAPTFRGDTDEAVAELRRLVADDWEVLVATEGPGLAKRITEVLAEHDVASRLVAENADTVRRPHHRHHRRRRPRLPGPRGPPGRHHRDRPHRLGRRLGHLDQGHAADAVAAPQPGRPPPAAPRRLRGARAARCGPVRRDDAAHRRRRHPRVPRARVRPGQARPPRRPALRAHRPARPGHPLRRRRAAHPQQDGRLRLAADQEPRQALRQADRRRADPPLLRADGDLAGTRSRPTPHGSASSRTPSRTSRRPTS